MRWGTIRILAVALALTACVSTAPPSTRQDSVPKESSGLASWYGQEFAGRTTANGEIFDPLVLSAAHRTLPFGTIVDVTNRQNHKTVQVRINDRGPFIGGRIIDLSFAAAEQIGLIEPGVGEVDIVVRRIGGGDREPPAPYNVQITPRPVPSVEQAPPVIAAAPEPPPPAVERVPVIAPAGEAVVVDGSDLTVIEERQGVAVRREVGPDGRSIVTRPLDGKASETTPTPVLSTATGAPRRTPVMTPPMSGSGGFVVQLGAFSREKNAKDLATRVSAVLSPVFVERSGDLYRLRVGPYASRDAAVEARMRLEDAGFSGMVMPAR